MRVVLWLLAAGMAVAQAGKPSAEELYKQMSEAFQAKDYSQVEFWAREMQKSYPRDERWWVFLMGAMQQQGHLEDAVKLGRQIQPQFKDSVTSYLQIGTALLKVNRPEEALPEFQTALRYSVGALMTALVLNRLGTAQMQLGRYTDAVAAFRREKELTGRAVLGLALALSGSGDHEGEIIEYRAVLRENPNQPVALNNLAYSLAERSEGLNEALSLAQRAVGQFPGNAAFMDTLGWIYFKKGQLLEAESTMIEALLFEGGTQDTLRDHLVAVMDARGDWSGARRELRDLVDKGSKPGEIARMKVLLGQARRK